MHILNIARAIKKISVKKIKEFLSENYYKRIGFSNQNNCYSIKHLKKDFLLPPNKLIERIPDPGNAK